MSMRIGLVVDDLILDLHVGTGKSAAPRWGELLLRESALEWMHPLLKRHSVTMLTASHWLLRETLQKKLESVLSLRVRLVNLENLPRILAESKPSAWMDTNLTRVLAARDAGVLFPVWVCRESGSVDHDLFGISIVDDPFDILPITGGA